MLVVSWFIGGALYLLLYFYLFNKFNDKKFKINSKMIFASIVIGILYFLVNQYAPKFGIIWIRPLLLHLYSFLSLLIIYKQKFLKTLITILYILLISCLAEFIFDFVAIFIFKVEVMTFGLNWYTYLISNVIIFLLSIFLSYISILKKIFRSIIDWCDENEYKSFAIFVILSVIIFTFLLYNNFVKLLPNSILWLTNIFCIGVLVFIIGYFKEKGNNSRIITEYDQLLDYVKKYEKVIEEKSKNQHEYKNQLTLIKGMIPKTNKKVLSYIDGLYSEQKDDNDVELLKKLQYLPTGGLKGLIYYKLEEMLDKKLKVFIDISPSIKNERINKKLDKNLKDISKAIGVYMDNAIEATEKTKEKYVVLEVYLENDEFVFSLSNSYNNQISLNKIDNNGYSTKGEGHGYGLSLVKDIIDKNKDIRQERSINSIYYVQKLYIKK